MNQVIAAVLFNAVFGAGLCLTEKHLDRKRCRVLCWGLLIAWAGAVFYLALLSRTPGVNTGPRVIPFWSYEKAVRGLRRGKYQYFRLILLNILVFMPFGMLVHRVNPGKDGRTMLIAMLSGLCVSLTIETLQFFCQLGVFEVDDLINNTMGSVIGAGSSVALSHLCAHRRKEANHKERETT